MSRSLPPLAPGVCRVWWARAGDVDARHDALLAPDDLARRARLRREADRRLLTAAWALARIVLGDVLGVPPAEVPVDRTCPRCGEPHGRPELAGVPGPRFSVSHSGDCVAVAVCRSAPVGVDVEALGRFGPAELADVAAAVLAPGEHAGSARGLTTTWTRKEALLKATGEGLSSPLDRVVLSAPDAPPRVLRWDGGPARLHDLHPPAGHVGALAVLGHAPQRVVEDDGAPLLAGVQRSRRLPSATTRSQRYP
jgi:4'-phosphopantetheinyl transferase